MIFFVCYHKNYQYIKILYKFYIAYTYYILVINNTNRLARIKIYQQSTQTDMQDVKAMHNYSNLSGAKYTQIESSFWWTGTKLHQHPGWISYAIEEESIVNSVGGDSWWLAVVGNMLFVSKLMGVDDMMIVVVLWFFIFVVFNCKYAATHWGWWDWWLVQRNW